jgi:hypothetical protein
VHRRAVAQPDVGLDGHRPDDDGSERDTTPGPPVQLRRSHRARERSSLDASWPCGQDAQPKPGCHRRRDQRTRREAGFTGPGCRGRCRTSTAFSHRLGGFVLRED